MRRGLVVDQGVEDLVDHPEVVLVLGELLLEVHQIVRHPVQPGGRDPQHRQCRTGPLREERRRVLDDMHDDVRARADRCRGRTFERDSHLTEDRAGVVDPGEHHTVTLDGHAAGDQDVHPGRFGALADDDVAGGHRPQRQIGAEVQEARHADIVSWPSARVPFGHECLPGPCQPGPLDRRPYCRRSS